MGKERPARKPKRNLRGDKKRRDRKSGGDILKPKRISIAEEVRQEQAAAEARADNALRRVRSLRPQFDDEAPHS